jgi:hypothetical protein
MGGMMAMKEEDANLNAAYLFKLIANAEKNSSYPLAGDPFIHDLLNKPGGLAVVNDCVMARQKDMLPRTRETINAMIDARLDQDLTDQSDVLVHDQFGMIELLLAANEQSTAGSKQYSFVDEEAAKMMAKPGGLTALYRLSVANKDQLSKHTKKHLVTLMNNHRVEEGILPQDVGVVQPISDVCAKYNVQYQFDTQALKKLILNVSKQVGAGPEHFVAVDSQAKAMMAKPGGLAALYRLTEANKKELGGPTKKHLLTLMNDHCVEGDIGPEDEGVIQPISGACAEYGVEYVIEMKSLDNEVFELPRKDATQAQPGKDAGKESTRPSGEGAAQSQPDEDADKENTPPSLGGA